MVHSGGHGRQGPGTRDRRPGKSTVRPIAALAILVVTLVGVARPTPASAQPAIGFYGGGTVDPEQILGGVFFQSGDIFGGLRVRPGVDGGTGEGLRLAAINLDVVYGFPLGATGWTLIQGGGPSIVITRIPEIDVRETSVGFHYIFGFGHDSGFFTEVRLGSGVAQSLSVAAGWAIVLD